MLKIFQKPNKTWKLIHKYAHVLCAIGFKVELEGVFTKSAYIKLSRAGHLIYAINGYGKMKGCADYAVWSRITNLLNFFEKNEATIPYYHNGKQHGMDVIMSLIEGFHKDYKNPDIVQTLEERMSDKKKSMCMDNKDLEYKDPMFYAVVMAVCNKKWRVYSDEFNVACQWNGRDPEMLWYGQNGDLSVQYDRNQHDSDTIPREKLMQIARQLDIHYADTLASFKRMIDEAQGLVHAVEMFKKDIEEISGFVSI